MLCPGRSLFFARSIASRVETQPCSCRCVQDITTPYPCLPTLLAVQVFRIYLFVLAFALVVHFIACGYWAVSRQEEAKRSFFPVFGAADSMMTGSDNKTNSGCLGAFHTSRGSFSVLLWVLRVNIYLHPMEDKTSMF